jgi:putative transposase
MPEFRSSRPRTGQPHFPGGLNTVLQYPVLFLQKTDRSFSSVKELVAKIDHYVQNANRYAQPFVWTATADSIFAKVERLCERIYGTAH